MALIFGSIIIVTGISILRRTIADLLDEADKEFLNKMVLTITQNQRPDWIDIHNLKMIKYGSSFYIDCDLTLPCYYTIGQGHDACLALKSAIERDFSDRVTLSVHSDSCEERHCEHCKMEECQYRKQVFVAPLHITLDELTETDEQRGDDDNQ